MAEDSVDPDLGRIQDLLVVEDNPGDTRLIEEAFENSQFDTTLHTVSTGEGALDFVNQRGEFTDAPLPDAVLLDWSLPKMDGEAVLSELKAEFPEILVVLMTGSDPRNEVVDSMEARADAYLTKPTEPDVYLEVVRSLL